MSSIDLKVFVAILLQNGDLLSLLSHPAKVVLQFVQDHVKEHSYKNPIKINPIEMEQSFLTS
jgi:hypothetical protein